jgi:hypothetical protein
METPTPEEVAERLRPLIAATLTSLGLAPVLVGALVGASGLWTFQEELRFLAKVGGALEEIGGEVVDWLKSRPAYRGPYTQDQAQEAQGQRLAESGAALPSTNIIRGPRS